MAALTPASEPAPSAVTAPPELGVVVVNYRSSDLIARNLRAIDWSALPSSHVVIVDNFSTPEERRAITRLADAESWELVASENLGFGAGMNLGVARAIQAGCTSFLLLNPDLSIDARTIARLMTVGREQPKTLLSPRLNRPDGSTWFAHGRLDRRTGLTRSRREPRAGDRDQWLSGACLLFDRDTWELLGGFDEHYFMYWEDIDLSQRLLERGGELHVLHDVHATHIVGGTQSGDGRSARYCYYMCRNRLWFAGAHLPRRDRVRWLRYAPAYTHRAVLDGWRSVYRQPARALAALFGTIAGMRAIVRPDRAATSI
jgi:GT2 family glycosyltransferase